ARRAEGLEAHHDRPLQHLLPHGRAPSPREGVRRLVRAGPEGAPPDDGRRPAAHLRLPVPILSRPEAVELPGLAENAASRGADPRPVAAGGVAAAARMPGVPARFEIARPRARRAAEEPHLHPLPGERPLELLVPEARARPPVPVRAPLFLPASELAA